MADRNPSERPFDLVCLGEPMLELNLQGKRRLSGTLRVG
jgi:hypothetical protein